MSADAADAAEAPNTPAAATPLLIVTGLSGAGKSSALNALEDFGYEAIDNLPLSLLPELVRGTKASAEPRPIAVGIDSRTRDFTVARLWETAEALFGREDLAAKVIFLDCDDDVLVRRYTETRRRHPLAADRPVSDGIALERRVLGPARDRADQVVDTTSLSGHELKRLLAADSDRFADAFTEKLATYALRRTLTLDDRRALAQVVERNRATEYRLRDLVETLVASDLFQRR
jgi:UPF0042 nucleotide-binding protein